MELHINQLTCLRGRHCNFPRNFGLALDLDGLGSMRAALRGGVYVSSKWICVYIYMYMGFLKWGYPQISNHPKLDSFCITVKPMVTGESPFIILRNTHICELDPANVRKQLLFRYVPTGLSTICWKLYSLVEINPFLVRWAQPSNAMDGQAGSPWACSARPTHCRQCGKGCRDSERCCFKNPQHCPKEIKSSERWKRHESNLPQAQSRS